MTVHIITIDGPSGSGKGTLAAKIAQHYQYHLLDSGALYRLLGLALVRRNKLQTLYDEECVEIAKKLDIQFEPNEFGVLVKLDGHDVTNIIRSEQVGEYASKVAVIEQLRAALLDRQYAFAQAPGLVADGRDMGTVVFPNAGAKIYLTASAESRATRRYKQLQGMGSDAKMSAILENIQARDKRDMEREVAPLKPASDAYIIDSSDLTIDEVFQMMKVHIDRLFA
ncbi:(d)CMP kinase [Acinetobacter sp. ESL0695]|uniref:(d)CMP kinase n=1 Tax=Acinetobacter sp. ESL0695 TaxID=2983215 RepID=UPI0023F0964E|nr:(d)CMP kinase [Acinetobacter sp. ESL0695]WEV47892.1 (d)CMP kinase [Acinetobacter sp. ESL0695]